MDQNDFDEEQILWDGSPSFNSDSIGSPNGELLEIDSVISHESSAGFPDIDINSEQSHESVQSLHLEPSLFPEYYQQWLDYLLGCRNNPKQIADLNSTKGTSATLGNLIAFLNQPNVLYFLQSNGFTEYNNEMNGVYIQLAAKEFKKSVGFDEANFPFKDSGGPQKTKLEEFGYIFKYWVGKQDNSYKMRKFYKENGVAIFVVFKEETSPAISPSSSSEISVDTEPANKKPRVGGNSPFSNSVASSEVSSPTRLSNNNQPAPNGTNYYNGSGSPTSTSYSQQPTQHNGTLNNNNTNVTSPNSLHSPEHLSDRIDSLTVRVDEIASRMVKVELNGTTNNNVTVTDVQRELGRLVLRVLRENGGRHDKGSTLATKVRKLLGRTVMTKIVNNVLYTVLEPLGIVQLQGDVWVLIDDLKAKEFEQQQ